MSCTLSQDMRSNSFVAFRVENSFGTGFDLLWAGRNAANIPKEAITVDSSHPDIVLSDPFQWSTRSPLVDRYGRSELSTIQAGASLEFSFTGTAIWYACVSYTWNVRANLFLRYYSDIDIDHGLYTISIDGSNPEQLNGTNRGLRTQLMLWSKTDLPPGRHTFTLKQHDIDGKRTALDFFRSVISETTE